MSTEVFSDADATRTIDFWFAGCDPEAGSLSQDIVKRWFVRSEDFDKLCHDFSPILDRVASAHTPASISSLATTHRRALALLILLDQFPRNLFRDEKSAVVYTKYDLLSQAVSQHALNPEQGLHRGPNDAWIRNPMLAMWFILPLTHSEDIKLQERAVALATEMLGVCKGLDGVEQSAAMAVSSTQEHLDIIKRFGRYPYRNKVLGRESTEEEIAWLADPNVDWTR